MAKTPKLTNEKETEAKVLTPEEQMARILDQTKDEHLNFEESIEHLTSTGSLKLDIATGMFGPGLHRFVGITEGGKTSEALQMAENFLATPKKKRRGVYFKAEGRLTQKMKDRTNIQFVSKSEDWQEGTMLVFECNVFEAINQMMKDLVLNNPFKIEYVFIVDSMDALILRGDVEKTDKEANKVAGGAVLSSELMKRIGLRLNKLGHLAIFISQIRSSVNIDPYAKKEVRVTSATGGNALNHYPNFILEFEARYAGDLILENPKEKPDSVKNKILGHWAKVTIRKSTNESTGQKVEYPIKYGRKKGTSIWREYEIVDVLLQFEHINAKGAWINPSPESSLMKEVKTKFGERFPEKWHGRDAIFDFLETNQDITNYLFDKIKATLI